MISLRKYTGLLACLLAASFWSPQAGAQTLSEAVESTLRKNPSLDVANSKFLAAQNEQKMEESAYYPELSASATLGRIYQDNATSRGLSVDRGAAYSGYGEGSLALRQNIFDGYETKNRVEAAKARVRSFENNIADVRERLIFRTASAYLEVLRARAALKLLKEQRAGMVSYHERIVSMVEEGVADDTERQQAQDVVMVMNALVNDYEGALGIAESDYREVTGGVPGDGLVLPAALGLDAPSDLPAAIEAAVLNHPALKAAQLETEAAKHELEAQEAGYLPDLTGELSYLKSDKKDLIGGEVEDARAVVRLNWSFATGGEQEASIEHSRAKHKGATARTEELRRGLERTIYQAYADLQTFRRKRDLAAERVSLNKNLFASYTLQFESARVNLLHLMRAESQLYKACIDFSDAQHRALLAEYAVLASLGSLSGRFAGETLAQSQTPANPAATEPAAGSPQE